MSNLNVSSFSAAFVARYFRILPKCFIDAEKTKRLTVINTSYIHFIVEETQERGRIGFNPDHEIYFPVDIEV